MTSTKRDKDYLWVFEFYKKAEKLMKDNKKYLLFIYLVATIIVFMSITFFGIIPNHSLKSGGEYSMWVTLKLFPVVFFFHGAFSRVMLRRKAWIFYFVFAPLLLFIYFYVQRLFYFGLSYNESLISALIGVILYFPCICIGFVIMSLCFKIMRFIF